MSVNVDGTEASKPVVGIAGLSLKSEQNGGVETHDDYVDPSNPGPDVGWGS